MERRFAKSSLLMATGSCVGLFVLTFTGDRISAFTRFDNSVLAWFGLPRSLPSR